MPRHAVGAHAAGWSTEGTVAAKTRLPWPFRLGGTRRMRWPARRASAARDRSRRPVFFVLLASCPRVPPANRGPGVTRSDAGPGDLQALFGLDRGQPGQQRPQQVLLGRGERSEQARFDVV